MNDKKPRFTLNSVDDLFTTQEQRDDEQLVKIRELDVTKIDQFPKHPYKVKNDADMYNLMESIKEHGVVTPAIVRQKKDGRYEMISGHRRLHACRQLGISTIPCEIVDMDKNEATIVMVDSNLQRTTILPSEKAFAYKMRLDAMKRQGKRMDLAVTPMIDDTSTPLLEKLEGKAALSVSRLGKDVGESREQIRRYIRLTELLPEILNYVDDGIIAMRPAVELSYIPKELQKIIFDAMAAEACTPSHDQTIRMRKLYAEGKLNEETIYETIREEKPNQRTRISIDDKKAKRYLPKDLPVSKREDFILKALEHYSKYLERQKDRER